MLYNKIFSFIDREMFVMKKSTEEITSLPKENFTDLIKIYLKCCALLKDEGYNRIGSNEVAKSLDEPEFDKSFIDSEILKYGSMINTNRRIAISAIEKITLALEKYLEQCLLDKNPQLDVFRDFLQGDFSSMEYVFKRQIFNKSIYISYENSEGETINILDSKDTLGLKKADIDEMLKCSKLTSKIYSPIKEISEVSFPKYKKLLLEAMHLITIGDNPLSDGLFLRNLNTELEIIRKQKAKKEADKKALEKKKEEVRKQQEAKRIEREMKQGVEVNKEELKEDKEDDKEQKDETAKENI